ncbi:F-box only protein 25 isoform X5 [Mustela putorius furo]|uniref:F-box only protein 25 isoform X5 n=1 Tax=Mustela putorius furo TaxID=9669 RepID=A0A8U0NYQ0_MUSPF|nr:F-box only protein 25 isoform X5 [Mustela putorius furo]XP_012919093.1 F-box only protein 25 isoform X5 [Mustela putorius furo]
MPHPPRPLSPQQPQPPPGGIPSTVHPGAPPLGAHCSSRRLSKATQVQSTQEHCRPSPPQLPMLGGSRPCQPAPQGAPALSAWDTLACPHSAICCLARTPPPRSAQRPPWPVPTSAAAVSSGHSVRSLEHLGGPSPELSLRGAPRMRAQRLHRPVFASPHVLSCQGAHTGKALGQLLSATVLPECRLHGEPRGCPHLLPRWLWPSHRAAWHGEPSDPQPPPTTALSSLPSRRQAQYPSSGLGLTKTHTEGQAEWVDRGLCSRRTRHNGSRTARHRGRQCPRKSRTVMQMLARLAEGWVDPDPRRTQETQSWSGPEDTVTPEGCTADEGTSRTGRDRGGGRVESTLSSRRRK